MKMREAELLTRECLKAAVRNFEESETANIPRPSMHGRLEEVVNDYLIAICKVDSLKKEIFARVPNNLTLIKKLIEEDSTTFPWTDSEKWPRNPWDLITKLLEKVWNPEDFFRVDEPLPVVRERFIKHLRMYQEAIARRDNPLLIYKNYQTSVYSFVRDLVLRGDIEWVRALRDSRSLRLPNAAIEEDRNIDSRPD